LKRNINKNIKIEFIGPPGSGKSSIAEGLNKLFANKNIPSVLGNRNNNKNIIKKINIQLLKLIIIDAIKLIPFIFYQNKTGSILNRLHWYNVFRGLIRTIAINIFLSNRHDNKIIILEPGYLTQILGSCMYSIRKRRYLSIKNILNKIEIANIVIKLIVDPEVSIDRLIKRRRGIPKRMKQVDIDSQKKIIINSNNISTEIVKYCNKKGSQIIEVDVNKHSLEQIINYISGQIKLIIK